MDIQSFVNYGIAQSFGYAAYYGSWFTLAYVLKEGIKELFGGSGQQNIHDLLRHSYIIGQTGCGKSCYLFNRAVELMKAGYGVLWLDTQGDIEQLLNAIPPERVKDVVYFDPYLQQERPIGLNVLEVNPKIKTSVSLVSGDIITLFQRLFGANIGPSTEDIIRNTVLAVAELGGGTLLEVFLMLKNEDYREDVSSKVKNFIVRDYLQNDLPNTKKNSQLYNPPMNKQRALLADPLLLNIVSQRKGLDFSKIIKQRKILICNLPKGLLGENACVLLASIIIIKMQLAIMSRIIESQGERLYNPYFLFLDEFQDYCNPSFYTLLEQGRKFGTGLFLSHQLTEQLNKRMLASIFGNVGSRYFFRVGEDDAAKLAKGVKEKKKSSRDLDNYREAQLLNLPNFVCLARELVGGKKQKPVLMKTPPPPQDYGHAELIKRLSFKCGTDRLAVEADIEKRIRGIELEKKVIELPKKVGRNNGSNHKTNPGTPKKCLPKVHRVTPGGGSD